MPTRRPPLASARVLLAGFGLLAVWAAACVAAPAVGEGGKVGLIVRHGDGRIQTACVAFEGESITGEELLAQSGLDVRMDSANALGSLICSIDGEGCSFPEEACLCRCDRPGTCGYWAYFGWDPVADSWTYAAQGARMRRLHDGDLDAWVWLESTGPEAVAAAVPKDVTFVDICGTSDE